MVGENCIITYKENNFCLKVEDVFFSRFLLNLSVVFFCFIVLREKV